MIELQDGRAKVRATMTLASATALMDAGIRLMSETASLNSFDLGDVTEVDSSGLAVVFGWLREAQRLGRSIQIANLPESLSSLAQVYDVSDLIPLSR